jgi:hypothetical protein
MWKRKIKNEKRNEDKRIPTTYMQAREGETQTIKEM